MKLTVFHIIICNACSSIFIPPIKTKDSKVIILLHCKNPCPHCTTPKFTQIYLQYTVQDDHIYVSIAEDFTAFQKHLLEHINKYYSISSKAFYYTFIKVVGRIFKFYNKTNSIKHITTYNASSLSPQSIHDINIFGKDSEYVNFQNEILVGQVRSYYSAYKKDQKKYPSKIENPISFTRTSHPYKVILADMKPKLAKFFTVSVDIFFIV